MNAFQKDVLSAIADDYEEIETIVSDLRNWHPDEQIKKTDVAVALQQLVEQGLASAFELSTKSGAATLVSFEQERVNELYFYVTAEGKRQLIG